MPLVGGDFGIHPMNLLTTALNDAVKANVVLKRIGSNNVIVVRIKYTSSNTRRLVDASSNGFEPDGHFDILRDDRAKNKQAESDIPSGRCSTAQSRDRHMRSYHLRPAIHPSYLALSRKSKLERLYALIHAFNCDHGRGGLGKAI